MCDMGGAVHGDREGTKGAALGRWWDEGGFVCEELTRGAGGGTTGSDARATEWSPGAGSEVAVGRCGMEDTSRGSGMGRSS